MATNDVKIILTAEDKTGGAIKSTTAGIEGLVGTAKKFAAAAGIAFATKQIIDFGVASVQAFAEAEAAQTRMAHILKEGVVKATDAQVEALQAQAEALEKVGVVSKEAILVGQGQLASFDLQAASIQKLIPSILNYAVAEQGANLSGEGLKAVTNGLAQALQGNFASLTKTGFILDEATKAMISNGTETERVAALVSVLDSTYNGLNETMRQTTEGQIVGMTFALDNLKEEVGKVIAEAIGPLIGQLTTLVTDPRFIAFFTALAKVAIGSVIVAVNTLMGAFEELVFLWEKFFEVVDKVVAGFNKIRSAATSAASAVSSLLSKAVDKIGIGGARAAGGPVGGGTPYLVGEQGPEIFQPKVAGDIIPNSKLGKGGGITINVFGNTLLDQRAATEIGDMIISKLKLSNAI